MSEKLKLTIETCDYNHKFAKLPDHPKKENLPRCPHCMAEGNDKLKRQNAELLAGLKIAVEEVIEYLGNAINDMDAVSDEDIAYTAPRIENLRNLIAKMEK